MSEMHHPSPPADDGQGSQTAEALIAYADLIDRHGLESAEARAYFAAHQHVPEFQELAAETRRLETQFRRRPRQPARAAKPAWRPFAAAVVGAVVVIGSLAGLTFSLSRSQELASELAAVQKDNEKLSQENKQLAQVAKSKKFVEDAYQLTRLGTLAGDSPKFTNKDGQRAEDRLKAYRQILANDPNYYATLAILKNNPDSAYESVVVPYDAGMEADLEKSRAIEAVISRVKQHFPREQRVQEASNRAIANLNARIEDLAGRSQQKG